MKKLLLLPILLFSNVSMAKYAHIYFPNGNLLLIFNENETELLSNRSKISFPKEIILNSDTLSQCGFKDIPQVKSEFNINALNAFFDGETTLYAIPVVKNSLEFEDLSFYTNVNEENFEIDEQVSTN